MQILFDVFFIDWCILISEFDILRANIDIHDLIKGGNSHYFRANMNYHDKNSCSVKDMWTIVDSSN